jgi:hypothetical protein
MSRDPRNGRHFCGVWTRNGTHFYPAAQRPPHSVLVRVTTYDGPKTLAECVMAAVQEPTDLALEWHDLPDILPCSKCWSEADRARWYMARAQRRKASH